MARINRPLQLALVLLALAIVLGVIGAILRAVRWLLYVGVVVLVVAGLVRWLGGSRSR